MREEALPSGATDNPRAQKDNGTPADPLAAIRGARVLSDTRQPPTATDPLPAPEDLSPEELAPHRATPSPDRGTRPPRATVQVQSPARGTATPDAAPRPQTPSRRRRSLLLSRVLPLAALVGLALAAIVLVTLSVMEESAEGPREAGALSGEQSTLLGDLARLAPVEARLGLTSENREAVLAACFRLSDNPNHECRVSHLRELGEYPARLVPMPALRMHLREVSNAEYDACADADLCPQRDWESCRFHTVRGLELNQRVPDSMRQPARPAVCVTADEAAAFCEASGMRLPTADEWERAARGGDDRLQPWGSFWAPALLNWGERDMGGFPVPGRLDGADLTASVFDYADGASPDGLLNMMGNAAEWVTRPQDPEAPFGSRGGSYVDDLRTLRLTRTVPLQGTERRSTLGFRCVMTDDPDARSRE